MLRLGALLAMVLTSLLSAQISIDTLALFPDTTTFRDRGYSWVGDVMNWGVRFQLDSTKEYTLEKILVMGHQGISASKPSKTNFSISLGKQPEDSVIYKSDLGFTAGYPEWQTITLSQPVRIKDQTGFYITGSLFLSLTGSIDYHRKILNQFVKRDQDPLFVWYEGLSFYFAIKLVVTHGTTAMNDREAPALHTYSLSQNYPNPFNSETMIQYSLPADDNVNIEVIDMLGRVVKKLFSGFQKSGEHKLGFNAQGFSGGIYFIRMHTPAFTGIKKMVHLK